MVATLTETTVEVLMTVRRNDADQSVQVMAEGRSYDGDGNVVRVSRITDVTSFLTANQVQGAGNVLTALEGRLKTLWNIP